MDMQNDPNTRNSQSPISWLKQDVEIRLTNGWLAAGGVIFLVLLIVALD